MAAHLFGDDFDPSTSFEFVARRPLLYEAACMAVRLDPFVRAEKDCRFAQPALVALLIARWADLDDGSPSTILVGEGVGEIAALAAGGALSFSDAIWLAAVRGRLMSRLAAESSLGSLVLRAVTFRTAQQLARSHDLRIVRDCAPEEVVLMGRRELIDAAQRTASRLELDAVLAPPERVFPTPDFAGARREWRAAVDAVDVWPLQRPVLSCTSVTLIIHPRSSVVEGLTGAIRMRQSRVALERLGVGRVTPVATSPVCA
jgi:acyl transferase domain-containing protein